MKNSTRPGHLLSSERGDLITTSIGIVMAAVLILAGIVMAVKVVPDFQDDAARDRLFPVVNAQNAAAAAKRIYLDEQTLIKDHFLSKTDGVYSSPGNNGSCFAAAVKSKTGNTFYVTNISDEPLPLYEGTKSGCLTEDGKDVLRGMASDADWALESAAGSVEVTGQYLDTNFPRVGVTKPILPIVNGGSGSYSYSFAGDRPEGVAFDESDGSFTKTADSIWGKDADLIDAGNGFSCLLSNGNAYCWGDNKQGQLGNGTKTAALQPVRVDRPTEIGMDRITHLDAGFEHTCAIAGGKAFCWGLNDHGQLGFDSEGKGDEKRVSVPTPVMVAVQGTPLEGKVVTDISTSGRTTCAVAGGQVYCWGKSGTAGLLGDGTKDTVVENVVITSVSRTMPAPVDNTGVLAGKTVTDVSAGYDHVCAVASGDAYCWGTNSSGQLGDGTEKASSVPVQVHNEGVLKGKSVTAISVGGWESEGNASTCAIASGEAFCWGSNTKGKLGNGSAAVASLTPTAVLKDDRKPLTSVTSINAAFGHACATTDKIAYCWGNNSGAQLGTGSRSGTPQITAAVARAPQGFTSGASSISGSGNHTCAIFGEGATCWGSNTSGKAGNGLEKPYTLTPSPVIGFGGVYGFPAKGVVTITDTASDKSFEMPVTLRLG